MSIVVLASSRLVTARTHCKSKVYTEYCRGGRMVSTVQVRYVLQAFFRRLGRADTNFQRAPRVLLLN